MSNNTPNNNAQEWEKRFVEEGAALEHARWSRWQAYLHKFLTYYEIKDGDRTIACYLLSADAYERWERQIATDYKDLPEDEKESDRKEVREYLPLVTLSRKEARQEAIEECIYTIKSRKDARGWLPDEYAVFLDALSALEKLLPSNKE